MQSSAKNMVLFQCSLKGPFTKAIFAAATQCNFCRAEVATSCNFVAILVQFVRANVSTSLFLNKSCVPAKK